MDSGSIFPGMVNTVGALLPALISLGLVAAGLTRSRLGKGGQLWVCVLALALSVVCARVDVTPDAISLHFLPGAAVVLCFLVWRGHYIPPCMAFAFTYASMLPVDVVLARLATGPHFNPEGIGGAGWLDGLLIFPALTALAIMYANWRMAKVGRAGLFWFGQRTGRARLDRRPEIRDCSCAGPPARLSAIQSDREAHDEARRTDRSGNRIDRRHPGGCRRGPRTAAL